MQKNKRVCIGISLIKKGKIGTIILFIEVFLVENNGN